MLTPSIRSHTSNTSPLPKCYNPEAIGIHQFFIINESNFLKRERYDDTWVSCESCLSWINISKHLTLERVLKLAFSVNTVLDRVILQRDFHLFKKVVQEPHVCLLCFNCVREEGIGLVWVHLFLRGPFHTDDERCLWDVLLDNSACFFIVLKTETASLLNQIRFSFMQIPKGHVKSPKTN